MLIGTVHVALAPAEKLGEIDGFYHILAPPASESSAEDQHGQMRVQVPLECVLGFLGRVGLGVLSPKRRV